MSRKCNLLRDKILSGMFKFKNDSSPAKRFENVSSAEEVARKITPKGMMESGQKRLNRAVALANDIARKYTK
jgi:hypothetical protein